ncbi:MAG: hypothetical protein AAGI23_21205 [Bacteroidota bacterium]
MTDDQKVVAYTDSITVGGYSILSNLTLANNGDIWVTKHKDKIVRFRDRQYLDSFDLSNMFSIEDILPNYSFYMLPYKESIVIVSKKNLYSPHPRAESFYHILKHENETWSTLLNLSFTADEQPKGDQAAAISHPYLSLNNMAIKNDQLYIATQGEECSGFQVFDISGDEELTPEDYFIVQDPNLDSQCFYAFEVMPNGDALVMTRESLNVFECR